MTNPGFYDGDGNRAVRPVSVGLRFTFDVPLEDPTLVLLHWEDGVLRRLRPPAVGSRWTETQPGML